MGPPPIRQQEPPLPTKPPGTSRPAAEQSDCQRRHPETPAGSSCSSNSKAWSTHPAHSLGDECNRQHQLRRPAPASPPVSARNRVSAVGRGPEGRSRTPAEAASRAGAVVLSPLTRRGWRQARQRGWAARRAKPKEHAEAVRCSMMWPFSTAGRRRRRPHCGAGRRLADERAVIGAAPVMRSHGFAVDREVSAPAARSKPRLWCSTRSGEMSSSASSRSP
jgi:hypothetical protein